MRNGLSNDLRALSPKSCSQPSGNHREYGDNCNKDYMKITIIMSNEEFDMARY